MPKTSRVPPESPFPKGIPQPALRALGSIGITRLDQVPRFTEAQLLALHGMGPKALGIIKAQLRARGMSLAKKSQPPKHASPGDMRRSAPNRRPP